jgi:hypothetical protein
VDEYTGPPRRPLWPNCALKPTPYAFIRGSLYDDTLNCWFPALVCADSREQSVLTFLRRRSISYGVSDSRDATAMRTSRNDPLRIAEVSLPGQRGVIVITLCPGKKDPPRG